MKLINKTLLAAAIALGMATLGTQANTVNGSLWEQVDSHIDTDGSFANVAIMQGIRAADVTFTVNSPISLNSYGANGYLIGGFLASGGATITSDPGGAANRTLNNTLFYFTGLVSVYNGQTFSVWHDDGLQLKIGGVMIVDVPGPTSPIETSYSWTGADGTYEFELAYAENCGAPGVLKVDLPLRSVPDGGSTLVLLGGVLGLLGIAGRRFHK